MKNNFDAIRICAATAVLYSHHHALTGQFEPLVLGIHTLGGFSVLIFFAISGYLVSASWDNDPNFLRFWFRRALRVWPAYIAVILITTYIFGSIFTQIPLSEYLKNQQTSSYLSNIWFIGKGSLPGVFVNNPLPFAINGSLWTISFEVFCYFILSIFGLIGIIKIKNLWIILISIAIIWYQIRFGPDFQENWKVKREMMAYFFVGSAIYFLEPLWTHRKLQTIIFIISISTLLWIFEIKYLALMLSVPFLAIFSGKISTPFINQWGRWGDPSYGIYLFAFPVQQAVIQSFFPEFGFFPTLFLSLTTTLTLAFLSWHILEKHALQLKPKKPFKNIK